MAVPRRIARLQQLIHEVAAETVQHRLADPRIGFVTLTRVKLSPDLSEATIYWSSLGTEAQRRTTTRALEAARPVVQSVVAKALRTRTTPTLSFRYDPTIAQAARLEDIFAKLKAERPASATPDEPASDPAKADPDEDAEEDDEGGDDDA